MAREMLSQALIIDDDVVMAYLLLCFVCGNMKSTKRFDGGVVAAFGQQ